MVFPNRSRAAGYSNQNQTFSVILLATEGDRHKKIHLPSKPRTAFLTENTNLMLKMVVSNRKKGYVFVNAEGDKLSITWFKDRIHHYAKIE